MAGTNRDVNSFLGKTIVAFSTFSFALTFLGICTLLLTGNNAASRDFVSYWASGQQLAHHVDPYDASEILRIERSQRFDEGNRSLVMRNPPWALPLIAPLGFIGFRVGSLVWSLLLMGILMVCVQMLWTLHGRPKNYLHCLGYMFAPALLCILAGQTALFALLGLVLFLRWHRRMPGLAGVSLWLCLLKPHLFMPSGMVLLVWAVTSKNYRVLAGASLTLALSTVVSLSLDRHAWTHYLEMLHASGLQREFIPCLAVALRLWLIPAATWIQYLPAAAGCAWAVLYFAKNRNTWDWMQQSSVLMLVSVLVAPYAWISDQAVLLPAIFAGIYLTCSARIIQILTLLSAAIEIQVLFGASFHSALYLWTVPAWFAWYLFAARSSASERPPQRI